jgi:hypothetical protein
MPFSKKNTDQLFDMLDEVLSDMELEG